MIPWLQLPPAPAMPTEAMPTALRLAVGKAGTLRLWQELWSTGTHVGRDIGRAEGIVGTSLVFVVLILAVGAVTRGINRSRGNS